MKIGKTGSANSLPVPSGFAQRSLPKGGARRPASFVRVCRENALEGENDGMANTNVRAFLKGVQCGVEQGLLVVLDEGKFTPVGMVVVVLTGVVGSCRWG